MARSVNPTPREMVDTLSLCPELPAELRAFLWRLATAPHRPISRDQLDVLELAWVTLVTPRRQSADLRREVAAAELDRLVAEAYESWSADPTGAAAKPAAPAPPPPPPVAPPVGPCCSCGAPADACAGSGEEHAARLVPLVLERLRLRYSQPEQSQPPQSRVRSFTTLDKPAGGVN